MLNCSPKLTRTPILHSPETDAGKEHSECPTCPPSYVGACAHWGDQAVILYTGTISGPTSPRYRVTIGDFCAEPMHTLRHFRLGYEYLGDDYDAALAAFHAAEAELLAGGGE